MNHDFLETKIIRPKWDIFGSKIHIYFFTEIQHYDFFFHFCCMDLDSFNAKNCNNCIIWKKDSFPKREAELKYWPKLYI